MADCADARVGVSPTGTLSFSGHGHGARGTRDYALDVQLAGGVVATECRWCVRPGLTTKYTQYTLLRIYIYKAQARLHRLEPLQVCTRMCDQFKVLCRC